MRAEFLAVLGGLAAACGNHTGAHDPTLATLSIDPPTSQVTIVNGVAGTEAFTATLTFADHTTEDVTADTTFAVDMSYGGFAANALSMFTAGKTQVTGTYQDKTATAEVVAMLTEVVVQTGTCSLSPTTVCNTTTDCGASGGTCNGGVSTMAPGWFSGATEDPTRAPTIAYPAQGVIVPPNLGDFDVHWVDTAGNDVFEVSLHTEFADVRMYVPGSNGAIAGGGWTTVLANEWTAAVGNDTSVQFQVRGLLSTNPATVGSSAP
jgi:hypothetical protein